MKPLLRTLLAINGGVVLLFGLICLLTPWLGDIDAPLAGFASTPAMIGQMLGVALVAFAAIQFHAMADGALTGAVARIAGHMMWLMGLVLLIWELALGQPAVAGDGRLVATVVGIGLVFLGLIEARLGGMVRGRERRLARGEISAARAEQGAVQASRDRAAEKGIGDGNVGNDPYLGTPHAAVTRDATEARFSSGSVLADSVSPVPLSSASWSSPGSLSSDRRVRDGAELPPVPSAPSSAPSAPVASSASASGEPQEPHFTIATPRQEDAKTIGRHDADRLEGEQRREVPPSL